MWPPTTLIHNGDIDKNHNTIYICWSVKEMRIQCLLGMLNYFCEVLRTKLDITREKTPWKKCAWKCNSCWSNAKHSGHFLKLRFWKMLIHHVKKYIYSAFMFFIIALNLHMRRTVPGNQETATFSYWEIPTSHFLSPRAGATSTLHPPLHPQLLSMS